MVFFALWRFSKPGLEIFLPGIERAAIDVEVDDWGTNSHYRLRGTSVNGQPSPFDTQQQVARIVETQGLPALRLEHASAIALPGQAVALRARLYAPAAALAAPPKLSLGGSVPAQAMAVHAVATVSGIAQIDYVAHLKMPETEGAVIKVAGPNGIGTAWHPILAQPTQIGQTVEVAEGTRRAVFLVAEPGTPLSMTPAGQTDRTRLVVRSGLGGRPWRADVEGVVRGVAGRHPVIVDISAAEGGARVKIG